MGCSEDHIALGQAWWQIIFVEIVKHGTPILMGKDQENKGVVGMGNTQEVHIPIQIKLSKGAS